MTVAEVAAHHIEGEVPFAAPLLLAHALELRHRPSIAWKHEPALLLLKGVVHKLQDCGRMHSAAVLALIAEIDHKVVALHHLGQHVILQYAQRCDKLRGRRGAAVCVPDPAARVQRAEGAGVDADGAPGEAGVDACGTAPSGGTEAALILECYEAALKCSNEVHIGTY